MPTHFERMLQLADDIFATKDDPEQLDVDQEVLERLRSLHPSTVSEYDEGEGPAAWILLIPTTLELMQQFLDQTLSEKALFESTLPGISYEALYLCSAMVLEEYRRKGIAKRLTVSAIEDIRKEHPLKALFVWTFSEEGRLGAEAIARLTGLPLHHRGMPATS